MITMRFPVYLHAGMAALAINLLAAPASAQVQGQPAQQTQTQDPPRPQTVARFDDPTIRRLLLDVQATWQVEQPQGGLPNYRASAEGGISFTVSPRACSPEQGCLGLLLIAVFTGVDASNLLALDGYINTINDRSPTAKVFRTDEGVVLLQAYINSAYGISYANAQAQILVFGQDINMMREALAAFQESR